MSKARAAIEHQPDYFVPVLFHRLRSGRIWYGTHESRSHPQNMRWDSHLRSLADGKTTVILGSALLEPYVGSQEELARQLAREVNYGFADSERDDLALVAQYTQYVLGRDPRETAV